MVKDDPKPKEEQVGEPGARVAGRSPAFKIVALALTVVCVATATGFLVAAWRRRPQNQDEARPSPPADQAKESYRYFGKWPKPDMVLVLSGQQHGYMQPCGCSPIQEGGLPRRYNFLRSLTKDRGWPVVAADLGDIAQESGPQALLKLRYSMEALKLLDYTAVGIGENEMKMPLFDALGEFALNNQSPRVLAANLIDKEKNFADSVANWQVSGGKDRVPKVGIVGVVAQSVAKKAPQGDDTRFDPVDKVLPAVVRQLQAQKAELLVLLFQGSLEEAEAYAKNAKAQPDKFPMFHVIQCLSEEEQASSRPKEAGDTVIVSVGHKGREVGVLGAYRTGKPEQPFEFRYELVSLDPDFETPLGKDKDNPVHALWDKYAKEVKDGNYLAKYPHNLRHPVQVAYPQAEYVGSETCKKCHADAYQIWQDHPHSHAYATLVDKAKRPSLRQYDGECVRCHVIGFEYQTGFTSEQATPKLKGVGCESCHGPGSLHVNDRGKNKQLRALMNPWKVNAKDSKDTRNRIDQSCQTCHDLDNSRAYKFEDYWDSDKKKKTAHYNPKE